MYLSRELEGSFVVGEELGRRLGEYAGLVERMGQRVEELEGQLRREKEERINVMREERSDGRNESDRNKLK